MSEREWRFYKDDMLRFAENVLAYTEGLTIRDFWRDFERCNFVSSSSSEF
jgi:uncharacterized protein with HEPN domain